MSAGTADPVEYAVAVDRYLAASGLGDQTRRIYRIALTTWTWPLVERTAPVGEERRRATPPVVPLALLDDPSARSRLRAAATRRAATTHPRTLNRELSTLRSALGWWHSQGWLSSGSLAEVEFSPAPIPSHTRLSEKRAAELFTAATRPLDPAGRGWTLRQLRLPEPGSNRAP